MKYDYKCHECGDVINTDDRADTLEATWHALSSRCGGIFKRVWGFHPDLRNCR